jgi:hypothetical protein
MREQPLIGNTAWCPFSPAGLGQPIAKTDEERRALIATAAYLRAERPNTESLRDKQRRTAAETELHRHFSRWFASHLL